MTPQQFIAKWKRAELSERSACQQHFLDLCEMLDQPKPAEVDPTGKFYTFEKGVEKIGGGRGWADVWMQGHFGWEYKGKHKHKDLAAAYAQLLRYRESLENPPLLVVCDLHRFEIHTNFTGTIKQVHAFDLDQLAAPANILLLRNVFTNPEALRPTKTQEGTETLEFPGSVDGPWKRYVHDPDARGIGTVRYPRIVARDPACAVQLAKRTLTNLYNEMPTWLKNAHAALDAAVFAAYGWSVNLSDDEILARLLELNLARAGADD